MLKLSFSYDSVLLGIEWVITSTFCVIFQFLTMFKTIIGAGAVGAEAASCYGSGSD
jgi:hypothetical protein